MGLLSSSLVKPSNVYFIFKSLCQNVTPIFAKPMLGIVFFQVYKLCSKAKVQFFLLTISVLFQKRLVLKKACGQNYVSLNTKNVRFLG